MAIVYKFRHTYDNGCANVNKQFEVSAISVKDIAHIRPGAVCSACGTAFAIIDVIDSETNFSLMRQTQILVEGAPAVKVGDLVNLNPKRGRAIHRVAQVKGVYSFTACGRPVPAGTGFVKNHLPVSCKKCLERIS